MAFIRMVPVEEATGKLKELYDGAIASYGYVPNYMQGWGERPEVQAAIYGMLGAVRKTMRLRRYELVTVATALALKCSY